MFLFLLTAFIIPLPFFFFLLPQIKDAKGSGSCKPCPVDRFYSGVSATALSQCKACAQDRTTGTIVGSKSKNACVCKKNDYYHKQDNSGVCLPCISGAVCPFDGTKLEHIYAKPGYWLPENVTEEVVDCGEAFADLKLKELARQRCCPTDAYCNRTRDQNWTTDQQCKMGYAGPLCVTCAAGFVLFDGGCIRCEGGSPLWFGVLSLSGVAFVLFLVTLLILKWTKSVQEHVDETHYTRISGMVSIIISWLQILSALTVTYKMAWPPLFSAYSQGTGIFVNLEIMSFLAITNCKLAVPFINKFLLQMLAPPFFILAVSLAWLLLKLWHGNQKGWRIVQRARSDRAQSIIIVIMQLLYPKLATRTFQMVSEGREWSSVRCMKTVYTWYAVILTILFFFSLFSITLSIFLVSLR